jgi:hypothetical protein
MRKIKLAGKEAFDPETLTVDQDLLVLFNTIRAKYGDPLGWGNNRVVFDTGKGFVVKIPRNELGTSDNFDAFRCEKPEWCEIARCRLVEIKIENDSYFALVMEKVTMPPRGFKYPDWTSYIDCAQVGFNRAGNLVVYDWA